MFKYPYCPNTLARSPSYAYVTGLSNSIFAINGDTFFTALSGNVDPPNIHNGNKNRTHTVPMRDMFLTSVVIKSAKNPANILMLKNISINLLGEKAMKEKRLRNTSFPRGKTMAVNVIVLIAQVIMLRKKIITGCAGKVR